MNPISNKQHARASHRMRQRARAIKAFLLPVLAFSVLAIFGSVGMAMGSDHFAASESTGIAAAALPGALLLAGPLREEDNGNPDGGGGGDPLADRIGKSIAKIQDSMTTLEQKAGEVSELKEEVEEFHKAVKGFEALSSDVQSLNVAYAKLQKKLQNVRSEVSGDPLKRILADEEKRTMIAAPALVAVYNRKGLPVPKEIGEAAERMNAIGEKRGVTIGASPGSNYIDDELITEVYQLAATYGKWSGFDVHRPSSSVAKLPVDTSDPDMLWTAEATAPSEEAYTGASVNLIIKKMFGWISVSNEMLEDDLTGLVNRLVTKFMRQTAYRLDFSCFAADGDDNGTDGEYSGIFDGGTSYVAASGNVSIATLDFEDFVGLVAGADEALVDLTTTRWWLHPQVLVQLLKIKDDNGRPIFLTGLEAPAAGGIGSILGTPVITANAAPKVDGTSKPLACYGDSEALAVAVRKDMEFASSTEALFTADKTVFRNRLRGGVKIKQATAFEVLTTAAS